MLRGGTIEYENGVPVRSGRFSASSRATEPLKRLLRTYFQIRTHAARGTIEDENGDWARNGRSRSVEPRRLFMGHRTADAVTTNLFSGQDVAGVKHSVGGR